MCTEICQKVYGALGQITDEQWKEFYSNRDIVDFQLGRQIVNPKFKSLLMGGYVTQAGHGMLARKVEHILTYRGVIQNPPADRPVLFRVDSGCMSSAICGDQSCDCNWQWEEAKRLIDGAPDGMSGLIIHHPHHEGKSFGFTTKMASYDPATGTYPVPGDRREFKSTVAILKHLGIQRVILLSNNPHKLKVLEENGIKIEDVLHLVSPDPQHRKLLEYKRDVWGHKINLPDDGPNP